MGRFAMFDLIYNYKHYQLDRIPKGLLVHCESQKTVKETNKLTVSPSVTKPHFDRFSFQKKAVSM